MAATSKAIGATIFGGYIVDWIGYYNTCLVYACLLLVTGTWQVLFLRSQGLIKGRVYYASKSEVERQYNVESGSIDVSKISGESGKSGKSGKQTEDSIASQLLQSCKRSCEMRN